jgi:membrane-associated protein
MIENWIVNLGLTLAYVAFFAIIFAESGLLIGFFLPGDSLLFTLGLFASQGRLDLYILIIVGIIAAISGDAVGYRIGYKLGPALFKPDPKRKFFNMEQLRKAEAYYEEHGVKTIILARFTPVVRSFAPILAGVSKMDYKTFATYNTIGGIGWITSLTSLGYFLGKSIPDVDRYILPIIALIILVSLSPAALGYMGAKKKAKKKAAKAALPPQE